MIYDLLAVVKIVVLGCGMVGSAMAVDLAKEKNLTVTVVDKNKKVMKTVRITGVSSGGSLPAERAAARCCSYFSQSEVRDSSGEAR